MSLIAAKKKIYVKSENNDWGHDHILRLIE